jgi:hypothetical protein
MTLGCLPANLRRDADGRRRPAVTEAEAKPWTVCNVHLELAQIPGTHPGTDGFRRAGMPDRVEFYTLPGTREWLHPAPSGPGPMYPEELLAQSRPLTEGLVARMQSAPHIGKHLSVPRRGRVVSAPSARNPPRSATLSYHHEVRDADEQCVTGCDYALPRRAIFARMSGTWPDWPR